jgi:hypothetical protein
VCLMMRQRSENVLEFTIGKLFSACFIHDYSLCSDLIAINYDLSRESPVINSKISE